MVKKRILTKVTGVLAAVVMTTMFVLPVFASSDSGNVDGYAGTTHFYGKVYITNSTCGAWLQSSEDADLTVIGKGKKISSGEYVSFSGSCSESTYASGYASGDFYYAYSNFIISGHDGYNKVYANVMD